MRHPPGSLLFIGNLGAPGWVNETFTDKVFEFTEGDAVIVIEASKELNGEALCLTCHGLLYLHIEDLELCPETK